MSTNFWKWLKAFNLLRLLENEILEMLWEMLEIVCEKNAKAFGGANVCKDEQVRKYFINSKIENEVFS